MVSFVAALLMFNPPAPSQEPIVAALSERLMTADMVARAKRKSGAPVEDLVRERAVIHEAERQAGKIGIDMIFTVKVFKAQIEANKIAQRAFLARWKGLPPFATVPNLARDVRPKLDRLTPTILEVLRHRHFWPASVFGQGPTDPIYRNAWKVAIAPLIERKVSIGSTSLPISKPPVKKS